MRQNNPTDLLYGRLKVYQPDAGEGPRINVDTVLLAHFARYPARSRVIELGCASGTISLILAKRASVDWPGKKHPVIEGIDINGSLIEMADRNAELNGLADRVSFAALDLREVNGQLPPQSYDVVVMNPPYEEADSCRPSDSKALAKAMHGLCCTLPDVVDAARYLLTNGGKFFLILRAKRLGELIGLLNDRRVRPKRLKAVYGKPDRQASVVMVEAVRDAGEGLIVEPPLFIQDGAGNYTADLMAAYSFGSNDDYDGRGGS